MPAKGSPAARWLTPDLVILLALLGLFAWAILQARAWPFRAALFPVGTAAFVLAVIVLKLLLDARKAGRSRAAEVARAPLAPAAARVAESPGVAPVDEVALVEDEAAAEADAEDIFITAPRAVWLRTLGWVAVFFVLLWVAGLLVTIPVFALAYLLVESRERPWVAVAYAVLSWGVIYGLFDQLLRIQLPTSAVLERLAQ